MENIRMALDAGITWVQLRLKEYSLSEIAKYAVQTKKICESYQAVCIINDYPELVRDCGADGVHLGLEDKSPAEARNYLNPEHIIGGTANTLLDVQQRIAEKCSYIGLGPYTFTHTKQKLSPVLGIEGYNAILSNRQVQQSGIPVYAIGGILTQDVEKIMKTGVYGIAVSGVLTHAANPAAIVNEIKNLV